MSDEESKSTVPGEGGVAALVSVLGLVVLAYVAGVLVTAFKVFPYEQIIRPAASATGVLESKVLRKGAASRPLYPWHVSTTSARGVVVGEEAEGYTFYTSADGPGAKLVDGGGEVVHSWKAPFGKVWPRPRHVGKPAGAGEIYWQDAHLDPTDGSVLATYAAVSAVPYGYGLVKLDRNSEVVWRFEGRTHDDLDVDPRSGDIYVLTHRRRDTLNEPVPAGESLERAVISDAVVRLSADGEVLGRVDLLDALGGSEYWGVLEMYPTYIERPREEKWDPLHANSVEVIGPEFARHHDFAEPGQLLVSFRAVDTIAVLDFEAGEVVWASRGLWWQQSDAVPMANGNVLVFDANGHGGPEAPSRVLEVEPDTEAVVWSYKGRSDDPLWSPQASDVRPLSDGRVLVNSAAAGRLLEIDRDGEIRWEYLNPARQQREGREFIALTTAVQRVEAAEFLKE